MTADIWKGVTAAKMPAAHLVALGPLRANATVRVNSVGDAVWVRWQAEDRVVTCLRPVPNVEFFTFRDGVWFRLGHRLPASDAPPRDEGRSLDTILVPDRFETLPSSVETIPPVQLGIVRGGEPRPATALVCEVVALARWAEIATTSELATVQAARCGQRAILLEKKLPAVPDCVRYWGDDVLLPLGYRPEPNLPAAVLRAAVGVAEDELLMLDTDGAAVIPRAAFAPLTRAGLRLALRGEP